MCWLFLVSNRFCAFCSVNFTENPKWRIYTHFIFFILVKIFCSTSRENKCTKVLWTLFFSLSFLSFPRNQTVSLFKIYIYIFFKYMYYIFSTLINSPSASVTRFNTNLCPKPVCIRLYYEGKWSFKVLF